jgi:hypothetical protein
VTTQPRTTSRRRATIELALAAAALIGCVLSWLAAASTANVAPVLAGEPAKTSTVYDPSLITLSVLLLTVAGVLLVLGVTRMLRATPNRRSGVATPVPN